MSIEVLLKTLIMMNVHPKYYSIGVEIKDDAYNVERLPNGKFAEYYMERGTNNGLKVFDTEQEALQQLVEDLKANMSYGVDLSK